MQDQSFEGDLKAAYQNAQATIAAFRASQVILMVAVKFIDKGCKSVGNRRKCCPDSADASDSNRIS